MSRLAPHDHWVQRCAERDVPGDHAALYAQLIKARAKGGSDEIEYVKSDYRCEVWRFFADGIKFYAVFKHGFSTPTTVLTHAMYRRFRWRAKANRRGNSNPCQGIVDWKKRG